MHFTVTKFALDSAVVEAQTLLSSHGGFVNIAMYHHRVTIIILTHYDETKKSAYNSQIIRDKENLKLSHGGPSYSQASDTD